jgi:hypothetical protein
MWSTSAGTAIVLPPSPIAMQDNGDYDEMLFAVDESSSKDRITRIIKKHHYLELVSSHHTNTVQNQTVIQCSRFPLGNSSMPPRVSLLAALWCQLIMIRAVLLAAASTGYYYVIDRETKADSHENIYGTIETYVLRVYSNAQKIKLQSL